LSPRWRAVTVTNGRAYDKEKDKAVTADGRQETKGRESNKPSIQ
jgi:hypothetical protein